LLACLAPTAAAERWSAPIQFAGPRATDLSQSILAISPAGRVAVAFSSFDEDSSAAPQAWLATPGHVRPVKGAQEVLDLAYAGGRLSLLTVAAGSAWLGGRRVAADVGGGAIGRLESPPGGRTLTLVASNAGVWVGARRVSDRGAVAVAAAETAAGRGAVAWSAGSVAMLSWGGRAHPVALAGSGHSFGELGLAPDGRSVTVALTDGWFDAAGAYHSVVRVDGRTFAVPGQTASGLRLAGSGDGTQVLAFKSCNRAGSCWVRVAYRRAGGAFSAPAQASAIDPSQEPAATVTAGGTAVVGWVVAGRVYAISRPRGARGFSAPHRLSPTDYASALTLAGGPGSEAVAVWTQGTVNPSVVGAMLR
jgi:hypothetical protein